MHLVCEGEKERGKRLSGSLRLWGAEEGVDGQIKKGRAYWLKLLKSISVKIDDS